MQAAWDAIPSARLALKQLYDDKELPEEYMEAPEKWPKRKRKFPVVEKKVIDGTGVSEGDLAYDCDPDSKPALIRRSEITQYLKTVAEPAAPSSGDQIKNFWM